MPRNEKKPVTSVTVVRMMDEAVAGSWPRRRSTIGTSAPARPAITIDTSIAMTMISTRPKDRLQM